MLHIPLNIGKNGFLRDADLKTSIINSIEILMQTPIGGNPSDPQYGFVFNNFRFEIFNENEGTILENANSDARSISRNVLYDKKISGTSRNINTFAIDLKEALARYEPRLEDVTVSMSYVRIERMIYFRIRGVIVDTHEPFSYDTQIKAWN